MRKLISQRFVNYFVIPVIERVILESANPDIVILTRDRFDHNSGPKLRFNFETDRRGTRARESRPRY